MPSGIHSFFLTLIFTHLQSSTESLCTWHPVTPSDTWDQLSGTVNIEEECQNKVWNLCGWRMKGRIQKSLISLHKNLKTTHCTLVHTHTCTFRPIYPVSHPPHTYRFTHICHHTHTHTDARLITCLFMHTTNPCTCGLFSMETCTPHIHSLNTKPSHGYTPSDTLRPWEDTHTHFLSLHLYTPAH